MLATIQSNRGDKRRRFSEDHKVYRDFKDVNVIVYDKDAMNNAIKNILMTRKGSLPGKPEFGSDLYKVPFSQLDYITENLMKTTIKDALDLWEPRVVIESINITRNDEYNKIIADIQYRYRYNGQNIYNNLGIPLDTF